MTAVRVHPHREAAARLTSTRVTACGLQGAPVFSLAGSPHWTQPEPRPQGHDWVVGFGLIFSHLTSLSSRGWGKGHKKEGGAGRGRVESQSVQLEPSEHGHGCESVQKEEAHGGLVLAASRVWVSFLRP